MGSEMKLLDGFKSLSESGGRYTLLELNDLSFSGSDLSGEPGLSDMLADPVILSLMIRDGIRADEIDRLFNEKKEMAA